MWHSGWSASIYDTLLAQAAKGSDVDSGPLLEIIPFTKK